MVLIRHYLNSVINIEMGTRFFRRHFSFVVVIPNIVLVNLRIGGILSRIVRRAGDLSGFIAYGVESQKEHFITGVKNYPVN